MNTWKKYLEQDREYKSETIQSVTEKAVAGQSFEDQLSSLSTALQSENSKLQGLLKEHELEVVQKQAAKKKAAEAAAAKKK
jgi:outer membrane murein-binding lipoprotein Lpp